MIRVIRALDWRYVHRVAGTGKFVSRLYAMANPRTTVRERRDDSPQGE